MPKADHITFTAPGTVELLTSDLPTLSPGWLEVEAECSLVSPGTERSILFPVPDAGEVWQELRTYPYKPGYSHVGRVVQASPESEHLRGRRVSTHSPHQSVIHCATEQARLVPETVAPEEASLCTLAEVALNGVRRAGCPLGARCAVLGLGLVGQLAALFLGIGGAEEVVVFDPIAERRMLIPQAPPFIIAEYPEAIPRARFDIVIEASGNPDAMTLGASLARNEGSIAVVSSPRSPALFDFHDDCNRRSLKIVGSHYFSHPPEGVRWNAHENGDYFLSLLAQQRITVRGLISEIVRPERATDKYASLEGTTAGPGFLIDWR